MDWIGEGLPFEGTLAERPRLLTLADPDVPTCALDEAVAQVRGRLGQWDLALVVVGPQRVVLGPVRAEALGSEDSRPIAGVMEEGPITYRPHVTAEEMAKKLKTRPAPFVVVTTLSGHLLGVARSEAIQAAAGAGGG